MSKNFIKKKLFFFILITQFILLLLFPLKYEFWDQINYGLSDLELKFDSLEAHTIRILLIQFVVIIGNFFLLSPQFSFNIFLNILIFLDIIILFKIIKSFKISIFLFFVILSSPILITQFQNGRGIITNCGFLLLYYSLVNYTMFLNDVIKFFTLYISGILLLNVSSGAFLVGLIATIMYIYTLKFNVYQKQNKINNFILFFFLILFLSAIPLISIYLSKNIDYYNGSILAMLNHGIGSLLLKIDLFSLLILFFLFFPLFVFFYFNVRKPNELNLFLPFVYSSFIGLLFGFSSFFSVIYILIIYFILFFTSKFSIKIH